MKINEVLQLSVTFGREDYVVKMSMVNDAPSIDI